MSSHTQNSKLRTLCAGLVHTSASTRGTAESKTWAGSQQSKCDTQLTQAHLVVPCEFANSLTAEVHEGNRLCKHNLLPCYDSACLQCLVLGTSEGNSSSAGQAVKHLEANLQSNISPSWCPSELRSSVADTPLDCTCCNMHIIRGLEGTGKVGVAAVKFLLQTRLQTN